MKATRIDPDELIDCILAHKADSTREFLEAQGVAKYGTKTQLRERLEALLATDSACVADLAKHLDRIEGWGNQHIYLYKAPTALSREWQDQDHVKDLLRANNCVSRFNRHHPVLLPEQRTLSKVEWTGKKVQLAWTEKRSWEERDDEQDEESADGRVYWKAYVRKTARATLSFDWDLVSGHAMLLIRKLHRGENYEAARDDLAETLLPFLEISRFTTVRLNKAIVSIRGSGEVRGRLRSFETPRGGRVSLRSPSRGTDIKDDPDLARAEGTFGQSANNYGNFYWLTTKSKGQLRKEIRTTLHAVDHRLGIHGEWPEEAVRYVIGRVRFHCQQAARA